MNLYSVNLVRYYNYVAEAEDYVSAEDKAVRIHRLAENGMRFDDVEISRLDPETAEEIEED